MKFCIVSVFLFFLVTVAVIGIAAEDAVKEEENTIDDTSSEAPAEELLDYAKGSVCGYCTYCKFCELCKEDCPCETSPSKPNCRMCKYCKFCYLCSAVCDTVCTPGGILDRVSASIVSSLPTVDHSEVDSDIDSVKPWIDKKKDEL